ncbi:MAG: hypothetical protein IJ733_09425 [Lachnospiraceae bacterium]|nr:hypothetical protein [Lachnospiraceae bacterium]
MAIPKVSLDEKDLYYQWLINNNSTSTMLNALSGGTDSDSSSLGVLSSLANTISSGSYGFSGLGSVTDSSVIGALGSLSGLGGTESVSSFARILESYLQKNSSGVSDVLDLTQDTTSAAEAASMAEKLSGVLAEAAKTEDTSSLTYRTVKEIYDYFSEQVSKRATDLLGDKAASLKSSAEQTVSAGGGKTTAADSVYEDVYEENYFDQMDQMAIRGEEFDFSVFDELVNNSFGTRIPKTPV